MPILGGLSLKVEEKNKKIKYDCRTCGKKIDYHITGVCLKCRSLKVIKTKQTNKPYVYQGTDNMKEDRLKYKEDICFKCKKEIPHHVTTWFGSVCLYCKKNESKRKST